MGLRFRKSIKLLPGVRLNLNKKSTSISFGGRGARYTVSSTGKKTASVGIPGTGLSYSTTVGDKSGAKSKPVEMMACPNCESQIEAAAEKCPVCQSKIVHIGGGQFSEWWPVLIALMFANFALKQLIGGTWQMFYVFAALTVLSLLVLAIVQVAKKKQRAAFVHVPWRLRLWYVLPLWFIVQLLYSAVDIISYL